MDEELSEREQILKNAFLELDKRVVARAFPPPGVTNTHYVPKPPPLPRYDTDRLLEDRRVEMLWLLRFVATAIFAWVIVQFMGAATDYYRSHRYPGFEIEDDHLDGSRAYVRRGRDV